MEFVSLNKSTPRFESSTIEIPQKIASLKELWDKSKPNLTLQNPFCKINSALIAVVSMGETFWSGLEESGQLQVFEKIKTIPHVILKNMSPLRDLWNRLPRAGDRITLFDAIRKNPEPDHWIKVLSLVRSIPGEHISPEILAMIEENPNPHWGNVYRFARELLEEFADPVSTLTLAKLILEDRENRNWKYTLSAALYILRNIQGDVDNLVEMAQCITDNCNQGEKNTWKGVLLVMHAIWKEDRNLWILLALIEFYPLRARDAYYDWKTAVQVTQEILSELPVSFEENQLAFIHNIIMTMDSPAFRTAREIWKTADVALPMDRWLLTEAILEVEEEDEEKIIHLIQTVRPIWEKLPLLADRLQLLDLVIEYPTYPWETLATLVLPLLPIIKNPTDWLIYLIKPAAIHPEGDWKRAFAFLPILIQEQDFLVDQSSLPPTSSWKKDLQIIKDIAMTPNLYWEERMAFAQKFWVGIPDFFYRQTPDGVVTRSQILLETPFPIPHQLQQALSLVECIRKECPSFLFERWSCVHTIVTSSPQYSQWEDIAALSESIWDEMDSLSARFQTIVFIIEHPSPGWHEIIHLGTQIWEGCTNEKIFRLTILNTISATFFLENWDLAVQNAKQNPQWQHTYSSEERLKIVIDCLSMLPHLS